MNPSHILRSEPIELKAYLSYEEKLIKILLPEVKHLENKRISLVKYYGGITQQGKLPRKGKMKGVKYLKLI